MKEIIKYVAEDGSEHATKEAAERRESLQELVNDAMSPLALSPELQQAVSDGKGWVHHKRATVVRCQDAILDLCDEFDIASNFAAFQERGPQVHPLSIIGRVLSEVVDPLSKAWGRFGRIDQEGREHQQQYFAYTAGPSADHVCLEDRR